LKKKSFILLLLALLFILSSCNNGGGSDTGTTSPTASPSASSSQAPGNTTSPTSGPAEAGDPNRDADGNWTGPISTIQVMGGWSALVGIQKDTNYIHNMLRDRIGVVLDYIPMGDNPTQTIELRVAAGDLPDVIGARGDTGINMAIEAGLAVCLDDHKDALPALYEYFPEAIAYWATVFDAGEGRAYFAPGGIRTAALESGDTDIAYNLMWNLYDAIGRPHIRTYEDLLPILKQMVEYYPENADGQKVYAISPDTRSDGNRFAWATTPIQMYGRRAENYLEINFWDNTYMSIFSDNSQFKRALKWLFTANQMGLLDPDALTQTSDDQQAKLDAGRVLYEIQTWRTAGWNSAENDELGIGFAPFYAEDQEFSRFTEPSPFGGGRGVFLGTKGNDLDAALRFLNFTYDHKEMWDYYQGRQGWAWDIDENGPYMTEWGWDHVRDVNSVFPEGGRHGDGFWQLSSPFVHVNEINPVYDLPYNFELWPNRKFSPPIRQVRTAYEEHFYGGVGKYNGTIDMLLSTGRLAHRNNFVGAPGYSILPDEIQQINGRIAEFHVAECWLAVYAKDEAEFESIWAGIRDRAEGMGLQQSLDAQAEWYDKGLAYTAQFTGVTPRGW